MNPKDKITDEWLDGEPIPDDKNSGKGKSFAHHVVYADGTEEYTYFRYGNDQPVKTEQLVNAEQQKVWAEQQKKAATPPSEEPNPSDPTKTRIWDPTLNGGQGGWKEGVPIAQKPTTPAAPPPTRPKPENPQIYQTWDSDQKTWVDSGPIAEKPKEFGPGQHGAVVSSTTENRDGQLVKVTKYEDGFEQVASEPKTPGQHGAIVSDTTEKREGKSVRVTKYEDGFEAVQSVTEETGVDEPPGAPPIDLTPGNAIPSLVTYKNWLSGQTGLTQAQRTALLKERAELVKAAANEQAGVASISSGIMGEQGAEARSERSQANTRLSESQGTFRNAVSFLQATGPMMGRNGPDGAAVLDALLARGKAYAQEMGGLKDTPRNPVPTQLQPYYSVPGQPAAAGAPPAGAPATAPAPPPGSVQMAPAPAPTSAVPTPQPLYAPPVAPQPATQPAQQQPQGAFSEMDAIMRRVLDPNAVDLANNVAISMMLGGGM